MTHDQARGKIEALDAAAGRALLALHAFDDAPDAPGRILAGALLRDAVRDASRIAYEIDIELRVLGIIS